MIIELETAIYNALLEPLQALNCDVLLFPDDARKFDNVSSGTRVLIGYQSERQDSQDTFNGFARLVTVLITVEYHELRSHQGAYAVIDKVIETLTKFEPFYNFGTMDLDIAQFVATDEDMWFYSMFFKCLAPRAL